MDHKRGQGMNLRMYLKPFLSPEQFTESQYIVDSFPTAIDALINTLVEAQPADPATKLVFSEQTVTEAKDRMTDASLADKGKAGERWRVWMPPELNHKFKILKSFCAPAGTTVPVFVEMLLAMIGRRGTQEAPQNPQNAWLKPDMSLLQLTRVHEEKPLKDQLEAAAAHYQSSGVAGSAGMHYESDAASSCYGSPAVIMRTPASPFTISSQIGTPQVPSTHVVDLYSSPNPMSAAAAAAQANALAAASAAAALNMLPPVPAATAAAPAAAGAEVLQALEAEMTVEFNMLLNNSSVNNSKNEFTL
jgi:hypothetical protein